MKTMIAAAALLLAAPAIAQTPSTEQPTAPAAASATAVSIANRLFPDGTYRKMMGPAFTKMMSSMTDSMGTMPIGPILKAAGLEEARAGTLDKVTIQQIADIMDPVFKQRMDLMMNGMFAEMVPIFEKMEPDLRDGLALALQSRFTAPQLAELQTFFTTPTGSSYASEQMMLFMDPAVIGKMQAQMPKIMEAMPAVVAKSLKAMESLPKRKAYKDLTKDERARLAALLSVDPKKMK